MTWFQRVHSHLNLALLKTKQKKKRKRTKTWLLQRVLSTLRLDSDSSEVTVSGSVGRTSLGVNASERTKVNTEDCNSIHYFSKLLIHRQASTKYLLSHSTCVQSWFVNMFKCSSKRHWFLWKCMFFLLLPEYVQDTGYIICKSLTVHLYSQIFRLIGWLPSP